jgi:ankyrin repeat protein
MMAAGMAWMEYETLTGEDDYVEAAKYVASLGVDIDAQNSSGDTALHGVVQQGPQPTGFDKVVMTLHELGADINLKNKRGQTPLKITRGYGAAGGNHVRLSTDALLVSLGGTE